MKETNNRNKFKDVMSDHEWQLNNRNIEAYINHSPSLYQNNQTV